MKKVEPIIKIKSPIKNSHYNKGLKEKIEHLAFLGFSKQSIKLYFDFNPTEEQKKESNLLFSIYKSEIFFTLKQQNKTLGNE